jgi:DNA-3-methyladenine glycosylase I
VSCAGDICAWALRTPLERIYHDEEWGLPLRDDRRLFELLVLEYMQAGLSWSTILLKREAMRAAFDGFDVVKVSAYDDKKIEALMRAPGIIKNRLKLNALPNNARAFIRVQEEFGSFADYFWGFVDHRPIDGMRRSMEEVPARTLLSEAISRDMKKRGFSFVGPTVVYAYMQAAGLVNDHVMGCARYGEIKARGIP